MTPQSGRPFLRVTMLLYGDVDLDSRVRREAESLVARGHEVSIATLTTERRRPYRLDGARVLPLRPARRGLVPGDESPFRGEDRPTGSLDRLSAGGRWAAGYAGTFAYWARAALHRLPPADVWHGHDLLGLMAAWALRRKHGGALVHDSHELFLEAGSAVSLPAPIRAMLRNVEGRASRAADAVITVNDIIAAELRRLYRVDPIVVMNCPRLEPPPARLVLRERLGLGGRPVVIHHGVMGPGRGIDILIEAIPQLPADTAVVLLGRGPLAERFSLQAAEPAYRGRLYVVPAVPIADVPSWIGDADVATIPFQAVDRNNVLATPNKLFEYLAAGIPMVVSDFPELRRIVTGAGAGLAVDTTSSRSLAAALTELLEEPPQRRETRRASARRAYETTYNWQAQSQGLLAAYDRIATRASGPSVFVAPDTTRGDRA
jgi:glycosyltransferase involved in cell wall biosynthesis